MAAKTIIIGHKEIIVKRKRSLYDIRKLSHVAWIKDKLDEVQRNLDKNVKISKNKKAS